MVKLSSTFQKYCKKNCKGEEGDQIEWLDNNHGSWTLRKVELENNTQSKPIEYICSGQLIPDNKLVCCSALAGGTPSL
ncbi:hypothetical protein TUMSATVNIG1_58690 (plasmid) [Vibrio nigripulchritudo]|uniref:hypothetical protein n=1 Tax=Vibrio nigripulchritudo TaxID=28173 RepID=UPI001C7664DF|nr:hypothetical protein [Vibrio nigripulchritudo]BCL73884.1 hypothetical protein VNTUMSATTG_58210 [Vibrio nigripulchritudo]BDU35260.1 hypothetical protein TUMSATVNIG1_58690 [Vibrio nigripulchritudo]